jgi:hypothetical protein
MAKSLKNDTCHAMVEKLTLENEALKKTVDGLKSVNDEQLKRLIQAELLKDRVRELEKQIADKKGQ